MKKGAISIDGTGIVSVTDCTLNIGGLNVVEEIARQLGIKESDFYGKDFCGRISIVVENLEVPPVIENTMTDDEKTEANDD